MYYNQYYTLLLVQYGTLRLLGMLIGLRQIMKQGAGVCWAFWIDLCTFAAFVTEGIWWYQSMKYVQGNRGHLLFLCLVLVSLIHSAVWKRRTAKGRAE